MVFFFFLVPQPRHLLQTAPPLQIFPGVPEKGARSEAPGVSSVERSNEASGKKPFIGGLVLVPPKNPRFFDGFLGLPDLCGWFFGNQPAASLNNPFRKAEGISKRLRCFHILIKV